MALTLSDVVDIQTGVDTDDDQDVVVDLPSAGLSAGDLAVVLIAPSSGLTGPPGQTAPSEDWTDILDFETVDADSNPGVVLWVRAVPAGGLPATETWTFDANNRCSWISFGVVGADVTPDATGTASTGQGTTASAPSVTASVDGVLVLRMFLADDAGHHAGSGPPDPEDGHTLIGVEDDSGSGIDNGEWVAVYGEEQGSSGDTGTMDLSGLDDHAWAANTLVLASSGPSGSVTRKLIARVGGGA